MNLKTEFTSQINKLSNKNPAYVRNIMKEVLQDFTLNYVYNSKYNQLIFTGGTCLRKVYGLDRLSEDLDFDFIDTFNTGDFAEDLKDYFKSNLNIITDMKIAENNKTVFIKIPIEKIKADLPIPIDSNVLFLRCDFSLEEKGGYEIETNTINAANFSFFVKNYSLPTLFSNKIVAFLERSFYKGKIQDISFKGRDIYDLFWLINLSSKTGFNLKPNKQRLFILTGSNNINEIRKNIQDKLYQLDPKYVYEDLYPLVEDENFLNNFIDNYKNNINDKIGFILH
jgi:predicted nucleotidyltransferase component of viral defense system